ncbi:MAG TPA: helix-turn-helix transcriptional regulator [Mycobacteriales bacterium]|nr:helix-turn-helix transcriptional regulator [Mycobacteriales bacterium]
MIGAVLRALRESIGHTQETLAGLLQISPETVQSWESGRRPLINAPFIELQRLRREMAAAGVRPSLLRIWDQALTADALLSSLCAQVDAGEPHPFAHLVPDRTLSELLGWPLTGQPPRELRGTKHRLHVPSAIRDELASGLRSAATSSTTSHEQSAMLRRQARYFVASHPSSQDWLDKYESRDRGRYLRELRDWSPEWPVVRSEAVSSALRGDVEPLKRFIGEGLTTDRQIEANLQYWAYWVGEMPVLWSADSDMLTPQHYSGELLLDSLITGLESAPYRDLCVYSIWALLIKRPRLIENSSLTARLRSSIEVMLSASASLDNDTIRRLDQIAYRIGY